MQVLCWGLNEVGREIRYGIQWSMTDSLSDREELHNELAHQIWDWFDQQIVCKRRELLDQSEATIGLEFNRGEQQSIRAVEYHNECIDQVWNQSRGRFVWIARFCDCLVCS